MYFRCGSYSPQLYSFFLLGHKTYVIPLSCYILLSRWNSVLRSASEVDRIATRREFTNSLFRPEKMNKMFTFIFVTKDDGYIVAGVTAVHARWRRPSCIYVHVVYTHHHLDCAVVPFIPKAILIIKHSADVSAAAKYELVCGMVGAVFSYYVFLNAISFILFCFCFLFTFKNTQVF